eukprot:m.21012 g.21012  ORF g.21012 m.21012 type:complete len:368 (-) comp5316_c0_seq1:81-1184(-)
MFGGRGRQQQTGARSTQGPRRVEVKAGRMNMVGTTVTAQPEKGLIFVEKDDFGLTTFNWMDRDTNVVEEQLIVFPQSQKFLKCKSAPETSRVFYLKINDARHFYWMQDTSNENDDLNCENLNKAMNGESFTLPGEVANQDQQGGMIGMTEEQQQMMRMLGLDQLATPQHAPGFQGHAPNAPSRPQRREESSSLVSSRSVHDRDLEEETNAVTDASSPQQQEQQPEFTDEQQAFVNAIMQGFANESQNQGMLTDGASLSDVLTVENLETLLVDEDVLARLTEHLPEGTGGTRAEVLETIRSPQFAQRLNSFTAALQSGELGPVMSQFGVDPSTMQGAGVLGLIGAIQAQEDANGNEEEEGDMDEGHDN